MFGRTMTYNDWLYYLCWTIAGRALGRRVAAPARPDRPGAARDPRQRGRGRRLGRARADVQDARVRRQRVLRRRRRARCSRSRSRSSTRTAPTRCRSRSTCSSASSSAGSARSCRSSSARSSSSSLPDVAQQLLERAAGRPAIVFGAALILVMFAAPERCRRARKTLLTTANKSLVHSVLSAREPDSDHPRGPRARRLHRRRRRAGAARTRARADPGVTDTSVKIGGTVPLSGVAAAYAAVGRGAEAYFEYVNARGGVAGRKIDYKMLDDAYLPVEHDPADAQARAGGPGLRDLQQPRHRAQPRDPAVPEPAQGAAGLPRDRRDDVRRETRRSTRRRRPGSSRATSPRAGSTARRSASCARARRSPCSTRTTTTARTCSTGSGRGSASPGAAARSSPRRATRSPTRTSPRRSRSSAARRRTCSSSSRRRSPRSSPSSPSTSSGWKPQIVVNAVASASNTMKIAELSSNKRTEGAISIAFIKDPTDPRWRNDAGGKLYRQVFAQLRHRRRQRRLQRLRDGVGVHVRRGAQEGRAEPDADAAARRAAHAERDEQPVPAPRASRSRRAANDPFPIEQAQLAALAEGPLGPVRPAAEPEGQSLAPAERASSR